MRVLKLNKVTGLLIWTLWMAIVLNLVGSYVSGERNWHRETHAIAASGLDSNPRATLETVIVRSVERSQFAWKAGLVVMVLVTFIPVGMFVALGLVVGRKAPDELQEEPK